MKRLVKRVTTVALAFWMLMAAQLAGAAPSHAEPNWPPDVLSGSTHCEDGDNGAPQITKCDAIVDFGGPLSSGVWFDVDTVPGTAQAEVDYVPLSQRVYVRAGVSRISIWIEIVNDRDRESDETFFLRLSGGSLGRDVVEEELTIIDQDL